MARARITPGDGDPRGVGTVPLARRGTHKAAVPAWADAWWCYRLPSHSDEAAVWHPDTITLGEWRAAQT